jgi:DNA-binding NtrC family response regulator
MLSSARLEWTGNIRELEAVLERARNRARAAGAQDPVVQAQHLDLGDPIVGGSKPPAAAPSDTPAPPDIQERVGELNDRRGELDAFEKALIEDTLTACRGIVAKTARVLAVPRTSLIGRMAMLEIEPDKFKRRRES